MKSVEIIRSWKDEDYRLSLSDTGQALLPEHPAGLIELTDEDLSGADGATDRASIITICGRSHLTICVFTLDFAPCSLLGGCPTWGPLYCLPNE